MANHQAQGGSNGPPSAGGSGQHGGGGQGPPPPTQNLSQQNLNQIVRDILFHLYITCWTRPRLLPHHGQESQGQHRLLVYLSPVAIRSTQRRCNLPPSRHYGAYTVSQQHLMEFSMGTSS